MSSRSLLRKFLQILATVLSCVPSVSAQTGGQAAKVCTLNEAVDLALANYPAVQAVLQRASAARAGVKVAQTAYLPRTDLLWQENRATDNNVTGLVLPQSVIPPISGPVKETTSSTSVWGSAAGALFSWEPFDFGLRGADVNLARAVTAQANAGVSITRLDVATAAADAFLSLLAAEQTVQAAQANVERLEVFATAVHSLVKNELRPGADGARADAELAASRNQLILAEQGRQLSAITLAEVLGLAGTEVIADPGRLTQLPTQADTPESDLRSHPLAVAQAAAVDTARAREHVLDRSYFPRLNLQAAFFARGSGAQPDGQLEDGAKGLRPDTANWASGLTVSFPVFDIFQISAHRQAEASKEAAEKSTYEQTMQQLQAQAARARALVAGARGIAANAPIQLAAARDAERQAQARYKAALGTVTEVAEAQHLLAQAESDTAVARLNVWRAELITARAQGDLTPFLQQAAATPTPGAQ